MKFKINFKIDTLHCTTIVADTVDFNDIEFIIFRKKNTAVAIFPKSSIYSIISDEAIPAS